MATDQNSGTVPNIEDANLKELAEQTSKTQINYDNDLGNFKGEIEVKGIYDMNKFVDNIFRNEDKPLMVCMQFNNNNNNNEKENARHIYLQTTYKMCSPTKLIGGQSTTVSVNTANTPMMVIPPTSTEDPPRDLTASKTAKIYEKKTKKQEKSGKPTHGFCPLQLTICEQLQNLLFPCQRKDDISEKTPSKKEQGNLEPDIYEKEIGDGRHVSSNDKQKEPSNDSIAWRTTKKGKELGEVVIDGRRFGAFLICDPNDYEECSKNKGVWQGETRYEDKCEGYNAKDQDERVNAEEQKDLQGERVSVVYQSDFQGGSGMSTPLQSVLRGEKESVVYTAYKSGVQENQQNVGGETTNRKEQSTLQGEKTGKGATVSSDEKMKHKEQDAPLHNVIPPKTVQGALKNRKWLLEETAEDLDGDKWNIPKWVPKDTVCRCNRYFPDGKCKCEEYLAKFGVTKPGPIYVPQRTTYPVVYKSIRKGVGGEKTYPAGGVSAVGSKPINPTGGKGHQDQSIYSVQSQTKSPECNIDVSKQGNQSSNQTTDNGGSQQIGEEQLDRTTGKNMTEQQNVNSYYSANEENKQTGVPFYYRGKREENTEFPYSGKCKCEENSMPKSTTSKSDPNKPVFGTGDFGKGKETNKIVLPCVSKGTAEVNGRFYTAELIICNEDKDNKFVSNSKDQCPFPEGYTQGKGSEVLRSTNNGKWQPSSHDNVSNENQQCTQDFNSVNGGKISQQFPGVAVQQTLVVDDTNKVETSSTTSSELLNKQLSEIDGNEKEKPVPLKASTSAIERYDNDTHVTNIIEGPGEIVVVPSPPEEIHIPGDGAYPDDLPDDPADHFYCGCTGLWIEYYPKAKPGLEKKASPIKGIDIIPGFSFLLESCELPMDEKLKRPKEDKDCLIRTQEQHRFHQSGYKNQPPTIIMNDPFSTPLRIYEVSLSEKKRYLSTYHKDLKALDNKQTAKKEGKSKKK